MLAALFMTVVSAVFMSSDLISRILRVGYLDLRSAAAPVTIGVAPDVPPKASVPVPDPAIAETDAPGAPISGLIWFAGEDGPRADEPTTLPTSGTLTALETLTLTTTGIASWALMALLRDCWMTMVGTKLSPPPFEKLTASPGATRPISTAVAPASAARSTLRLTEQSPRSMSATLPAGSARYGSSGLPAAMEPAGQPRPRCTTSPVKPAPTGAQSTVAVLVYTPSMAAGLFTTSGKARALGTSVWATDRAVRALAGVPAMYGLLPPLPAAATVSMPRDQALSTASDRSSSNDSP